MNSYLPFKIRIHQHCLQIINNRILEAEEGIREIRKEAELNAKSSAGDQYETGRVIADLEIEKYQKALDNLIAMNAVLNRIDPQSLHRQAAPGALVCTDKGYFYIAVGLGKTHIDEQEVLVISMAAPIVSVLRDTPIGGKAVYRGNSFKIENIV